MNFAKSMIATCLFLTCNAKASDLSNVSTVMGSNPNRPNQVINCIVQAGMKAAFPVGRTIVGSGYATPVGNDFAPELMSLFFVDHDMEDHRAIHEIHLRSTDKLKNWQIFQEGTEIGYFSVSVSTEAQIFDKGGTNLLGTFDISSCR